MNMSRGIETEMQLGTVLTTAPGRARREVLDLPVQLAANVFGHGGD